MQYLLLNVMYSTLELCATGEILSLRLYYCQLTYPFGNTPNNDMIIEKPFLVLTSTMRDEVESRKMQFVILDVIYSTLVQCAT
jgi:hypothetical protein